MTFTLPQIRRFAFFISVLIIAFSGGWYAHDQALQSGRIQLSSNEVKIDRSLPLDKSKIDFSLFWQVWDKLEADYYDKSKLDQKEMVLGAIKGMVASAGDPYTVFLPPSEQKRTQEDLDGQFEGVGIEIGYRGTQLTVISPLEGSPAQKAGVQAGDYIIGIKDDKGKITSTFGMSVIDAVSSIRGPSGSKVTLLLTRAGADKAIEASITRTKIDVPSVVLKYVGDNSEVAHLQLKRFGGNTKDEWNQAIARIVVKKPKGIILDLRNNPGGYLTEAVSVASDFISSGVVVKQEDGVGVIKESMVTGRARIPQTPLVVLINGGSASASEIVAGALKDQNRAKLVGEKSFGKGTIQEARSVAGNAGLHITTAKWLTPNGNWVHEKGIDPDIEVKPEADKDLQLAKAVELLK
ncbi:MAG: S41 family peptidase [Candidatus Blackburnbacteria bacterium]|nr:S41 family peptidase [Candidatus Blackburnbacteria bacterium]